MDKQSAEIARKQQQMYYSMLTAFIQESRKTIESEKQLYLEYVDKRFAKIKKNNSGGYTLSQSGQPSLSIYPMSNVTGKTSNIR